MALPLRKIMKRILLLLSAAILFAAPAAARERWTAAQANAWYAHQAWPLGSNYIPAGAINQLEMWQADSFNPAEIDRELGWAQGLGMTTMRVFLHDALWQQDQAGFQKRIDTFLAIAARHHIKPLLVLFDSCWDPDLQLGKQRAPIPGVHNSGWVQSPGRAALDDPAQVPRLEAYVKGVIGAFAHDDRILGWDLWNEPDNAGGGNYATKESRDKFGHVAQLLPQVFAWAQSVDPIQPLTSGLWHDDDWSKPDTLNAVEKTQLEQSDVITFHDYNWPERFSARIGQLTGYGRPLICTEYMARAAGSTIDAVLPIAKRANVGMINWGFVNGKSQTQYPWESWQHPYVLAQPPVWFHDLLRPDGTPYRQREADILKAVSAAPKGSVPTLP
jgi:hypothetical protein